MVAHVSTCPIDVWALNKARRIIFSVLGNEQIDVYLFGSRATGDEHRFSDIDIALEVKGGCVSDRVMVIINELLEDSDIPYTVDVIDLMRVSDRLRDRVYREGIKWSA